MLRKMFLSTFVALATSLPVQATLIFELYRPVNQTNINVFATSTTGTALAGQTAFAAAYTQITAPIVLTVGQEMIVTVVLHQTNGVGADTFADASGQRLFGWGFAFGYLPGIAIHKSPITGTVSPSGNTSGIVLVGFSGTPITNGSSASTTIARDLTLSSGYFTPSTFYALSSFRLVGVAPGSGNLRIFDTGPSDDIGTVNTPGMDPGIYSHAPAGNVYNFPITVLALPTTGACCAGSTCSTTTSAACTGANRRFAGNGIACNPAGNHTTPCCKANFNQSAAAAAVTVTDIFAFLTAWFGGSSTADFNGVGGLTATNIFAFLTAWFAGCP